MIIKHKGKEYVCLLDTEDELFYSNFNWSYRCGYAGRIRRKNDIPGSHWVHLHREVLTRFGINIDNDKCVDHINRNKLDNRKENLRVVTKSENCKNVSNEVKSRRRQRASIASSAAALKIRTELQLSTSSNMAKMMNISGFNKHCGLDNHRTKLIINSITKQEFIGIRAAANSINMNYSTLRGMLSGRNPNTSPFELKY